MGSRWSPAIAATISVLGRARGGRRVGLRVRRPLLRAHLGIAQEAENPGFDADERVPRRLLHRRGELGLHRHLGRPPDERQQLLPERALGQVLVMDRLPLMAKDLEGRLQESHGARLYHSLGCECLDLHLNADVDLVVVVLALMVIEQFF